MAAHGREAFSGMAGELQVVAASETRRRIYGAVLCERVRPNRRERVIRGMAARSRNRYVQGSIRGMGRIHTRRRTSHVG